MTGNDLRGVAQYVGALTVVGLTFVVPLTTFIGVVSEWGLAILWPALLYFAMWFILLAVVIGKLDKKD